MSDNTERMLGQLDGKLDSLIAAFSEYRKEHNERHEKVDEQLASHAADINKAKGAKAAIYTVAAVISGGVGFVVAAAEKIFK